MLGGLEVEAVARVTQAQKLQRENEEKALAFFQETLGALPDPRRAQGRRYPLPTVIVTALMASVCGCDDAEAFELWGETNADWLSGFLDMPHGPASQDVYLAVFGAIDPEAFSAVFRSWVELLKVRLKAQGRHIAVDGKTSRRSFDTASGSKAIHTVSAWLTDAGLVIGQRKTEEKSNEIKAIPELLHLLDIRGATITIDAMGCQTAIASTIVDGGGHYLLAVKDNQPTLHQDIENTFEQADDDRQRSCDELQRPMVTAARETGKAHGRLETRTVEVCHDLDWLTSAERWPGLAFVARVCRERTILSTNKTSTETAYYIGSNAGATAEETAHTIRRHWTVETQLHWVLDVAFSEDQARHRARNTAQNMTTLRHFALNIVKQDKARKVGVATSRKRAGWDRNYLLELITGA